MNPADLADADLLRLMDEAYDAGDTATMALLRPEILRRFHAPA